MKARKLVALLMTILMLASMTAFANFDYAGADSVEIAEMNFEDDIVPSGWKWLWNRGTESADKNIPSNGYWTIGTEDGNKYLNLDIQHVDNDNYVAYYETVNQKKTGTLCLEYSFRYPTTKTNGETNAVTSVKTILSDTVAIRNRNSYIEYNASTNELKSNDGTVMTISKDKWYNIRLNLDISTGAYNVYVTDPETGVRNFKTGKTVFAGAGRGLNAIAFGTGTTCEFHVDNYKAYIFDAYVTEKEADMRIIKSQEIPLMDFDDGIMPNGWKYLDTTSGNVEADGYWKTGKDADGNGYMNIAVTPPTACANAYVAYHRFVNRGFTDDFAIEYSFRYPSLKEDGTSNAKTTVEMMVSDETTAGRTRNQFFKFYASNRLFTDPNDKNAETAKLDTWYDVKVDLTATNPTSYRTIITERGTDNVITYEGSGTLGAVTGRKIGLINFSVASMDNAPEFHVDNFRVYTYDSFDYNAGYAMMTEEMNNPAGWTVGNDGNLFINDQATRWSYVLTFANPVEGERYLDFVEDGSNKIMHIESNVVEDGNVDFRKQAYTYKHISSTKDTEAVGPQALLYSADVRIADPATTDTVTMYITKGTDDYEYTEIFSYTPSDKTVKIENKVYSGLNLNANTWYTINVYHNNVTGFMKIEFVNKANANDIMTFSTVTNLKGDEYGFIKLYGYGHKCDVTPFSADYDNLSVTGLDKDIESNHKFCEITSDITVGNKPAIGETLSASVDVVSYYDNGNKMSNAYANLYLAAYTEDGTLLALGVKPVIAVTGTYTAELTAPDGAHSYKAMLWDTSLTNLKSAVGVE